MLIGEAAIASLGIHRRRVSSDEKWLSYRELELSGRSLTPDEVREVTNIARRIAAILLPESQFDANYRAVKGNCYDWQVSESSPQRTPPARIQTPHRRFLPNLNSSAKRRPASDE